MSFPKAIAKGSRLVRLTAGVELRSAPVDDRASLPSDLRSNRARCPRSMHHFLVFFASRVDRHRAATPPARRRRIESRWCWTRIACGRVAKAALTSSLGANLGTSGAARACAVRLRTRFSMSAGPHRRILTQGAISSWTRPRSRFSMSAGARKKCDQEDVNAWMDGWME